MRSKILYICGGRSFHVASPGRKIASVAQCWRELGHDVVHVCGGDIEDGNRPMDYGSQQIYGRWYRRLAALDPLVQSVGEWRDMRHDTRLLDRLVKVAEDESPILIWERSSRLHRSGADLAKRLGLPYVLEWKDHLVPYKCSLFRRRALAIERKKNTSADFVVVESGVLRDALTLQGIPEEKLLVAHNAVSPAEFEPDPRVRAATRHALGLSDNALVVGYLGSYAFYHDAERLVLAAALLRSMGLRDLSVLMVGAGKEYPKARRTAEERGLLGTQLLMEPGVPAAQVPGILAGLDIAVLPGSTDIICPIKVQEYMASGLPVVVPDFACNREVVSDGITGLLFTPGDERDLAEKIRFLAQNATVRERIGRQAREEILRRFTWERTWGEALQTILHAVANGGAYQKGIGAAPD